MTIWSHIETAIKNRILILDGAMGTALQSYGLGEGDFRGDRFSDWDSHLKGNNDLLSLTRPDVVEDIHDSFLKVGADLIETNSFNATSISQADYGMEKLAPEIARASCIVARRAADKWTARTPDKPRAVIGAIGPMNKTLSISPKVEDPGFRDVTFEEVQASYEEQVEAMVDLVDAFMIETVFDTLNCKAAISAVRSVFDKVGHEKPLMISGTITDQSGRTLSGQTTEAFWLSIAHARPFAVGLNCALGADALRPYVTALSRVADTYILAYPNAGLPNAFGEYDETPEQTAEQVASWAKDGLVNILGGCCGTTPGHIGAIAHAVKPHRPHLIPTIKPTLRLSGLEPFQIAV